MTELESRQRDESTGLADLVARAWGGEKDAQRELFDRAYARLCRVLRGQGFLEYEDHAHFALMMVMRPDVLELRGDAEVFSWLVTVALNEARRSDAGLKPDRCSLDLPGADRPMASEDSCDDLRQIIRKALRKMDAEISATLALFATHKKNVVVASLLGVNEATVRWRIKKARKQIALFVRENYTDIYQIWRPYFELLEDGGHE